MNDNDVCDEVQYWVRTDQHDQCTRCGYPAASHEY